MRRFSSSFDSSSPRFVVTRPSTTCFALRQEAQRLEAARALVVPLEEEAVHLELVQKRLGDEVVAALAAHEERKLPRHIWVVTRHVRRAVPRAPR